MLRMASRSTWWQSQARHAAHNTQRWNIVIIIIVIIVVVAGNEAMRVRSLQHLGRPRVALREELDHWAQAVALHEMVDVRGVGGAGSVADAPVRV